MPSLEVKSANGSGAPAPPPIGTVIEGGQHDSAFQLTSVLGYGGYGVVYRAQTRTGTAFAVKCLVRSAPASNPKQQQRQFRLHKREVTLHERAAGTGANKHPHIIALHQVIEPTFQDADGSLTSPYSFLVMEFAPCGDLFTLILHKQVYLGRSGLCARVFAQLADAVSHCHKLGIYHRDLKPENVLCWDDGATVKLADFGLATSERRSKEWRTGSVYHMSPECQNGNANSPPYSPLANDIWSLAILLLNLLTARNPWAKASPSDQTFSAYLHGPANFLPQVLPISQGLNQVLVRALDINWEKRETFGVRGLADGVARLSFDKNEDLTKRQSGLGANYRRKGMGMYASDVVFEGGMARCPWEVGMHIPSGSSGNDDDEIPQHARVEQAQVESRNKAHREKVSTTYNSVENTLVESPRTQSTKAQKHNERSAVEEHSRWSHDQSADDSSPIQFTHPPSTAVDVDSMSDIHFATASARGPLSSATSSSPSSSSASSGSLYAATKTPAHTKPGYNPRVSETSSHLNAEVEAEHYYSLTYAADPETPSEIFGEQGHCLDSYSPLSGKYDGNKRRNRYRGRQPYPQVTGRNQTRGAAARRKPDLKLNLDIQNPRTFLPSMTPEASRSSQRNAKDLRMREESVSSCPFAYTISRSSYSQAGELIPTMDVDGGRSRGRDRDQDIHMTSPNVLGYDAGDLYRRSFDGHTLSRSITPYSSSRRPAINTTLENRSFSGEPLTVVGRSPLSPSAPGVDCNGRDIVKISRSTFETTLTSPTDAEIIYERSRASQSDESVQISLNYLYGHNGIHPTSPSPSSSAFAIRSTTSQGTGMTGPGGSMDTDFRRSNLGTSGPSWAEELSRVLEDDERKSRSAHMEIDMFELPAFPGTFPASQSPSPRHELRNLSPRPSSGIRSVIGSINSRRVSSARGMGLDALSQRRSGNVYDSRIGSINSAFQHIAHSTYSNEPRTHDLSAQASGTDEAMRQLHACAVGGPQLCPWSSGINTSGWNQAPASLQSSSDSTRLSQTFMAITTDSQAPRASRSSLNDFQEFAPYVNYADSLGSHEVSRQPVRSTFIEMEPTESFREPASSATSFPPTQTTSATTSQRESVTKSRRRSGSRTQSLLKFVARRPFSSSGSGFVRATTPSSAVDTSASVGTISNDATLFPRSCSPNEAPATPSAVKALSTQKKRFSSLTSKSSTPPVPTTRPLRPRAETHPKPTRALSINKTPKQVATTPKIRTWSFSRTRSNANLKRRSRSMSPEPTRGTAREVLTRLRSARNWFWCALSGMTSKPSSGAFLHSRKQQHERFPVLNSQVIGVAA